MKSLIAWALILPMLFTSCQQQLEMNVASNSRLIVMAGQSNAIGFAAISGIQPDLLAPIPGAKMFYGRGPDYSTYTWQPLILNQNNEGVDGRTGPGFRNYFGTEMRLMKLLINKYGGEFNLLKVGEGGTPLGQDNRPNETDWSPLSDGELFNISSGYENAGVAAIESLPPIAYIWIQGEDDANDNYKNSYQANLTNFIALKRQQFGSPEMAFIICRLGNLQTAYYQPDHEIIRDAQEYVATHVSNCYLVDFDGMPTSDQVHYTAEGYDIGAYRIFDVLKTIIPITLLANTPGCFIAKENKVLTEAGFEPGDLVKIISPGKPNRSFTLNSSLNTLTALEAGHSYYVIPGNHDVDQRSLFYP